MNLYYSDDYIAARHSFDTTRKSGDIAGSLAERPIAGVTIVAPTPITAEELAVVHAADYIEAVQTGVPLALAQSQGFEWDPGLWIATTASTGGVVAAARDALSSGVAGSLSSGLHHARHETGAGFCTFNGLYLAADQAIREGAREVLILDFDAHCGGGTASLVGDRNDITQIDISTNRFDSYEPRGRSVLEVVTGATYLQAVEHHLDALGRAGHHFDLAIYNAGMDPHGVIGIESLCRREAATFGWAKEHDLPIAFVLAGGYAGGDLTADGLVSLHRLTLEHAALGEWTKSP